MKKYSRDTENLLTTIHCSVKMISVNSKHSLRMIIKITPQTKDWIERSSKATGLDEKHVASALLSQAVEELKKKGLPLPLEKKPIPTPDPKKAA